MEGVLLMYAVIGVICGILGGSIGSTKGQYSLGFMLGLLLGPFGLLIAVLLPDARSK